MVFRTKFAAFVASFLVAGFAGAAENSKSHAAKGSQSGVKKSEKFGPDHPCYKKLKAIYSVASGRNCEASDALLDSKIKTSIRKSKQSEERLNVVMSFLQDGNVSGEHGFNPWIDASVFVHEGKCSIDFIKIAAD